MQIISVYSVISSILFYSLGLIILFVLRHNNGFMIRYAASSLLFLSVLSLIRLFTPFDLTWAYVIRSENFLPKVIDILSSKPEGFPLPVGHSLILLWCVGTFAFFVGYLIKDIVSYRAHRSFPYMMTEQLRRVSASLGIRYKIKLSPAICQPYTVGIIKPIIYLPLIKCSDDELCYILLHELQHIKSQDNFKGAVFLIVKAIFWWNPLSHLAAKEFEQLTELQCDASVAEHMDSDTVKAYLDTIVSVLKRLNPDEDKAKPLLAVKFAQDYDLSQRFEVLLDRKNRKPRYIRYAVWVIMLVLFVMSYFVIFQPYYPMPNYALEIDLILTNDTSYILDRDGMYYIVYNDTILDVLPEENLSMPPYDILTIIGE